jgi:hypothetical protein
MLDGNKCVWNFVGHLAARGSLHSNQVECRKDKRKLIKFEILCQGKYGTHAIESGDAKG